MSGIDLEDILFTVVYERNDSDYGTSGFSEKDTFDGIRDLKYELDAHAESINGYYEVIADGRNGDLIAVQFYGMNPEAPEDMAYSEIEELGYIEDEYVEFKCGLRESAISTIGDFLSK